MTAENMLHDVRNYLDITYADEGIDQKLLGIMERGMDYLDRKAGEAQDYEKEGAARALLFDYCRYARNNALELFEQNFMAELVGLRIGVQTDDYARQQGYI